jgi:hypothetical protein
MIHSISDDFRPVISLSTELSFGQKRSFLAIVSYFTEPELEELRSLL